MSCSSEQRLVTVGARGSPLSRAQVEEVLLELRQFHPEVEFAVHWVETAGDKDLLTSLRTLDKTDFFTREIDALQLAGGCRVGIHSAKDLPDPLPKGLVLAALTKGVDPSDVIVLGEGVTLENMAKVGTSSLRREHNIRALRGDLICVDIRGDVLTRLRLLDEGIYRNNMKNPFLAASALPRNSDAHSRQALPAMVARSASEFRGASLPKTDSSCCFGIVDGVVMAEAALIRLKQTHRRRIPLPGDAAPLQGQLAVLAVACDQEMLRLFHSIDVRCAREDHPLSGNRSDPI